MLHLATIANRRRHSSVGYALLSILGAKIQTLEKLEKKLENETF